MRRWARWLAPFQGAELRGLAQRGAITGDTRIRKGGGGEWVLAQRVRGLFSAPSAAAVDGQPSRPPAVPKRAGAGTTPTRRRPSPRLLAALSAASLVIGLLAVAVVIAMRGTTVVAPQVVSGPDQDKQTKDEGALRRISSVKVEEKKGEAAKHEAEEKAGAETEAEAKYKAALAAHEAAQRALAAAKEKLRSDQEHLRQLQHEQEMADRRDADRLARLVVEGPGKQRQLMAAMDRVVAKTGTLEDYKIIWDYFPEYREKMEAEILRAAPFRP